MRSIRGAGVVTVLCCLVGVTLFGYRAVYRSVDPSTNMDALLVPIGARIWIEGGNPYDPSRVAAEWDEDKRASGTNPAIRGRVAMVYPLGAYVLAAEIGALPANFWRPLWNVLNVALYLALVPLVLAIAEIRFRSRAALIFTAAALAMAPAHTNIAVGQTGVLVCFALVLAQYLYSTGASRAAGMSMGAALVLKPQTALIYWLYNAACRRSRFVVAAALTAGALMTIGYGALRIRGVDPLPDWLLNLQQLAAVSGNPFAPESPPHQLIDVASMLHRFLGPNAQRLSAALGLIVAGALAIAYAHSVRQARGRNDAVATLTDLSMSAVLAMTFSYHHLYDATLLILPLALVFAQHAVRDRRWWITLLLLTPFFVPAASMLHSFELKYDLLPSSVYENRWFVTAFRMQQNWTLLLLGAWLIAVRRSDAQAAIPLGRVEPTST